MTLIGTVSNPYSNFLAMIAIDSGHVAAFTGSDWDAAAGEDRGDFGRANALLERGRHELTVGKGKGVLVEIGGCGTAGVHRHGDALVIPEHYTGDEDDEAEAAFLRTVAMHPTTKPRRVGTVDVPSGVLVLKGLLEPGGKLAVAKVKKAGVAKLKDGCAIAVPPGRYEVWREEFRKEPEGAWGSMPSRVRVVPAGTKVIEGAPIEALAATSAPKTATSGERRVVKDWAAVQSLAIAGDGRTFAGECGTKLRVAAWHPDGTLAWERSLGTSRYRGYSARVGVQLAGKELLAHVEYTGKVEILDPATGKTRRTLTVPEARTMKAAPGALILRTGTETTLVAYPSGKPIATFEQYANRNDLAVSPDGAYFAIGGFECHIYDLTKRRHLHSLEVEVCSVSITPDHVVVVGDDEGRLLLIDAKTGKQAGRIDVAAERSRRPEVTALASSARHLAAARQDGVVVVVDRKTKKVVRRFDKLHVALPDTGATSLAGVAFTEAGDALWVSAGAKGQPVGLTRFPV